MKCARVAHGWMKELEYIGKTWGEAEHIAKKKSVPCGAMAEALCLTSGKVD